MFLGLNEQIDGRHKCLRFEWVDGEGRVMSSIVDRTQVLAACRCLYI